MVPHDPAPRTPDTADSLPSSPRRPARTFSRRTGIRAAALGATSLAAGLGAAAPGFAEDPAIPDAGDIQVGQEAAVDVELVPLWTAPRIHRYKTDGRIVTNGVDVQAWLGSMVTTETRAWLTGKLETQVPLGARVIVDEIDGTWARVVVPEQSTSRDPRGYPGWVPSIQLRADRTYLDRLAAGPVATVAVERVFISMNPDGTNTALPVGFGTTLPVLDTAEQAVRILAPGGHEAYLPADSVVVREVGETPSAPTAGEVLDTAESFRGLRYLYGGTTGWGFDGSGFVWAVLRRHGIDVARDAGDQRDHSGLVEIGRDEILPGDLVFFATEPGGDTVGQVAFSLGDDRILLSPDAAHTIEERSLLDENPAATYAGARRLPLSPSSWS